MGLPTVEKFLCFDLKAGVLFIGIKSLVGRRPIRSLLMAHLQIGWCLLGLAYGLTLAFLGVMEKAIIDVGCLPIFKLPFCTLIAE